MSMRKKISYLLGYLTTHNQKSETQINDMTKQSVCCAGTISVRCNPSFFHAMVRCHSTNPRQSGQSQQIQSARAVLGLR